MMTTDTRLVGQSVPRREDERLLRGRGAFVEDISIPGTQWASLVRSPHAHARIRGIDASEALRAQGVTKVLTGADIHPRYGTNPTVSLAFFNAESAPYDLIAVDKARHVGEVVAIVIANRAMRRGTQPILCTSTMSLWTLPSTWKRRCVMTRRAFMMIVPTESSHGATDRGTYLRPLRKRKSSCGSA